MNCEHCGKACAKRVTAMVNDRIAMVGVGCAKHLKRPSRKDLSSSYDNGRFLSPNIIGQVDEDTEQYNRSDSSELQFAEKLFPRVEERFSDRRWTSNDVTYLGRGSVKSRVFPYRFKDGDLYFVKGLDDQRSFITIISANKVTGYTPDAAYIDRRAVKLVKTRPWLSSGLRKAAKLGLTIKNVSAIPFAPCRDHKDCRENEELGLECAKRTLGP